MNYFRFLAGVFVSLILAACTAAHLDPVMTSATKNYFVQSVSVTSTDQFNAKIKTAANFNSAVQAGLSKDLPKLMHGKLPAIINIQMTSYDRGANTFQSPTTTVFGAVRIVDATSGATLAQFNIQADDAEMAARTNRDPAAALAANLLVAAVSPETDLQQNSLAGAFQAKVREALGGSTLF